MASGRGEPLDVPRCTAPASGSTLASSSIKHHCFSAGAPNRAGVLRPVLRQSALPSLPSLALPLSTAKH